MFAIHPQWSDFDQSPYELEKDICGTEKQNNKKDNDFFPPGAGFIIPKHRRDILHKTHY